MVTPDAGEPIYTTDTKNLYIGDGSTPGGVLVSGSGAGNFVDKLRGSAAIGSGVDSVVVSGLTLASAPAQVLVSVRKASSGRMNLFASVRSDSVSTAGFTADLSAMTDASTYVLDYLVIL